jgi:hypothetical protein
MVQQRIVGNGFANAEDAVGALVAVQAQDYLGALWALGLRMRDATERVLEQALAERRIVRTWPLRGTLHFVAADDVRWLLEVATPRVLQRHARRLRDEFDVDDKVCARARTVIERALSGGGALTRDALYAVLDGARISTAGQRGLHILWSLAQQGLLCFGARQGKQQTFVLLDEWLPSTRRLSREVALIELARRYFASRGPATLRDFTWWSGLAAAQAADALDCVKGKLEQRELDGRVYWFAAQATDARKTNAPRVHLLPAYDEYTVAYEDRSAALDAEHAQRAGNGIFKPTLLVDGRIAGTWTRTLGKSAVTVSPVLFDRWPAPLRKALDVQVARYAAFLGRDAGTVAVA